MSTAPSKPEGATHHVDGPPSTPLPHWLSSAPPATVPQQSSATPSARHPGEPHGTLSAVPLNIVEKLLQMHPALQSCGRAEIAEIAHVVRPFECAIGSTLLEASVPLAGLGLLVYGSAHAMTASPEAGSGVEAMLAPDMFGESLALGSDRANYNVVAGSACRVLWLPADAVYRLLDRAPGLPPVFAQRHARRQEHLQRGATPSTPSHPSMPAVSAQATLPTLDPFGHPEPALPGHAAPAPQPPSPTKTQPDKLVVSAPYDFPPPLTPRASLPPLKPIALTTSPIEPPEIHAPPPPAPPHGPTPQPPPPAFGGLGALPPLGAPSALQSSAAQTIPHGLAAPHTQPPAAPRTASPSAATPHDVIRFVEVSDYDLGPSVLGLVPAKLIRQHRLLPLKVTGTQLTVGLVAPRNAAALADLARSVQGMFEVEVVAISADDFSQAIVRHRLDDARSSSTETKRGAINPDTLVFEQSELEREPPTKSMGDEAVRLVNRIIAAALDRDASDIHLEPMSAGIRVRFRVNGVLHDWNEAIAPQIVRGVIARAKIMAGLDITERRRPQDGRIGLRSGRREFDLRVSCLPAARGEKVVLRVLDSAMATRPLGQVFLDQRILNMVRKALNRPYGGIIVGGATGAGKTSTLYAMLNERRNTRPDTHVTMVEDPIEYRLEGVTQVQVDPAADLGFAHVLRSMLRQDPDVIVVGEMRDSETARTALEAAMTGHVLLSSVHANNALSVVQRLEQLECGRPLISLSLALVLVQRLVRRLCSGCCKLVEAPQALVDSLTRRFVLEPNASRMLPSPHGCDACNKTGFIGRIAVFESMQLNDEVRTLLAAGAPLSEVEKIAVEMGALVPFASYARHLLREHLISAGEALLTVAE